MSHVLSMSLCACLLGLVGCQEPAQTTAQRAPSPLAPPTATPPPQTPSAQATADASGPCAVLTAADFEAVGLNHGKPKRESNMAEGGCTWDPVLGSGGFLHFEFLTEKAYAKRKELAGSAATTIEGLGDEAFVAKALTGHAINAKKGNKFFRIDGNAKLTPEKLESLARAAAGRI